MKLNYWMVRLSALVLWVCSLSAQAAELFLTSPDLAVRLSACLIYGYANLSQGQTQQARMALREIRAAMESEKIVSTQAKTIESFVAAAATVLLHLPLPKELPPLQQLPLSFFSD